MKNLIWIALLLACVGANAQSQCFTYSDSYGVYTNLSVSADGTTIYAATEVDGSGQMNFLSGNGCGSINYGSIYHTPRAMTQISWSGGSVGGMFQYGTQECPNCYLDITNTQSVPYSTTRTYSYAYEGDVYCSFSGGNILQVSGLIPISIGPAGGTYASAGIIDADVCVYTLACQAGTSISCTGANTLYEPTISGTCQEPGIETNDRWISADHGVHKYCFGEVSGALTVPGPCW